MLSKLFGPTYSLSLTQILSSYGFIAAYFGGKGLYPLFSGGELGTTDLLIGLTWASLTVFVLLTCKIRV